MTTVRVLRLAIILSALPGSTALPATQASAGAYLRTYTTGIHHRHAPRGLWHPGTWAIPILPLYGGCTDHGSPYWPCQTIPYATDRGIPPR